MCETFVQASAEYLQLTGSDQSAMPINSTAEIVSAWIRNGMDAHRYAVMLSFVLLVTVTRAHLQRIESAALVSDRRRGSVPSPLNPRVER